MVALVTLLIWGTTFVSTKVLLEDFTPVEILFLRFLIGFVALCFLYPHRMKLKEPQHEWLFVGAGLSGVTLYFLLENIALTYTFASNVGVIISITPFFVAVASHFFLKNEKLNRFFFMGFLVAMSGIYLIHFNGIHSLLLNPIGDLLTLLAGVVWAGYSVFVRKIGILQYNVIPATRRSFFYGILFMIPALAFLDFHWEFARLSTPKNFFNILFLGLGASALCFVSWNWAIKVLGTLRTAGYLYLGPVVTLISAALILQERITGMALLGTALTLCGLFLSEFQNFSHRSRKEEKKSKECL